MASTNYPCPMSSCFKDTVFGWYVVVAVPMKELVSIVGFPVYGCYKGIVGSQENKGVQEVMVPLSLEFSMINWV